MTLFPKWVIKWFEVIAMHLTMRPQLAKTWAEVSKRSCEASGMHLVGVWEFLDRKKTHVRLHTKEHNLGVSDIFVLGKYYFVPSYKPFWQTKHVILRSEIAIAMGAYDISSVDVGDTFKYAQLDLAMGRPARRPGSGLNFEPDSREGPSMPKTQF